MNPATTHRDSARARRRPVSDEYEFEAIPLVAAQTVRVKFRDIGQLPPMNLEDEVGEGVTVPGRVVSPEEHACMDAIERACETDNEGGR